MLSDILASDSFIKLVNKFAELLELAFRLDEDVRVAMPLKENPMLADDSLMNDFIENAVTGLKYRRYALLEPCIQLLDELADSPVDEIVKLAENYLSK